jgi:hypothetical protein
MLHYELPKDVAHRIIKAILDAKDYFEIRLKQYKKQPLDETQKNRLRGLYRSNPTMNTSDNESNDAHKATRVQNDELAHAPLYLRTGMDFMKPERFPRHMKTKSLGTTQAQRQVLRASVQAMTDRFASVFSETERNMKIKIKKKPK